MGRRRPPRSKASMRRKSAAGEVSISGVQRRINVISISVRLFIVFMRDCADWNASSACRIVESSMESAVLVMASSSSPTAFTSPLASFIVLMSIKLRKKPASSSHSLPMSLEDLYSASIFSSAAVRSPVRMHSASSIKCPRPARPAVSATSPYVTCPSLRPMH